MIDTPRPPRFGTINNTDVETTGHSRKTCKARSLRILVVDDDGEIRALLADMLAVNGHHVTTCGDGCSALDTFRKAEFDIVITDLGMSGMSGLDLAGQIHQEKPRMPVALITGWSSQVDPHQLAQKGVRAIIAKPFRFEEINALIERLTDNRE